MKIKGIKKIVSLGPDELSEYDLSTNCYSKAEDEDYVGKVKADVFIYWYENGGYDGSGIAVWRHRGKWAYQWLGHCSCYGPLEDVKTSDKAKFTVKQILKIIEGDYQWKDMSKLTDYLNRYYT